MTSSSYDSLLTDLRRVYEQVTGLPSPKIDVKNPQFPLSEDCDPVALVQNELHWLNLFLINSGFSTWLSNTPSWMPPADVYKNSKECVITIEAAGFNEDQISIQHVDNILIVRGTRLFERGSDDAQYSSLERPYGTFERIFVLSNDISLDKPKAHCSDGILRIKLPRIDFEPAKGARTQKAHHESGTEKTTRQAGSQKQIQDKERKK